MSAPFGPHTLFAKHEHLGEAPHESGIVAHQGGLGGGEFTQPPVELPRQKGCHAVPGGHVPASVSATQGGTGPPKLVEGCTQTCVDEQVSAPQAVLASAPASGGGAKHAQPAPMLC